MGELVYPEFYIRLNDMILTSGVEFEVCSSKESYFDWAKLKLTGQLEEVINPMRMQEAEIVLGYSGDEEIVFSGYVDKLVPIVLCKDEMLRLETTKITETFINATPQEIIRYGLREAGISEAILDSTEYPPKELMIVSKKSVIQLINQVNNDFDIDNKFFFTPDKTFYWGDGPSQKDIYEFSYGENIIELESNGDLWILKTIVVPFIRHSHKISVIHPSVSGQYEVFKIRHYSEGKFLRSEIYFK